MNIYSTCVKTHIKNTCCMFCPLGGFGCRVLHHSDISIQHGSFSFISSAFRCGPTMPLIRFRPAAKSDLGGIRDMRHPVPRLAAPGSASRVSAFATMHRGIQLHGVIGLDHRACAAARRRSTKKKCTKTGLVFTVVVCFLCF